MSATSMLNPEIASMSDSVRLSSLVWLSIWILTGAWLVGCSSESGEEDDGAPDTDVASPDDTADPEDTDTTPDDVDPCASAEAPTVTIEGVDDVLPVGTTSTEVTLRFSAPVTGVEAGTTVRLAATDDGPEPTLAAVTGEGPLWRAQLEGLRTNGTYVLSVVGADGDTTLASADCAVALGADVSQDVIVDGWSLREPIETTGELPAIEGPAFVEATAEYGIGASIGFDRAQVVDVDSDGIDDLVLWQLAAPASARVLRHLRQGPAVDFFENFTGASGLDELEASLLVFGDLDNDGDPDLVSGVGKIASDGDLGVWLNDGSGRFEFQGASGIADPSLGLNGGDEFFKEMAAATLSDLDSDGFLDLYIGTWYSGSPTADGQLYPPDDELYRNDGTGAFVQATLPDQHNPLTSQTTPSLSEISRAAYGICPGDFDDDGDIDLFVNNYGAGRPALDSPPRYIDHNFLWRNDGDMTLTDVGVELDVDATLRGIGGVESETEVVVGGTSYPSPIGGNGFGCQWGDLDNDGDLDLIVGTIAHPDYTQSDRTMLHYNPGDGTSPFTEESAARGLEYYEDELHPALVDVDNDGRLDIAMSRLRGGSKWELYFQNEAQTFERVTQAVSGVDIQRPGPTVWFDVDNDGDLDFFMPLGGGGRLMRNELGQRNRWLVLDLVATAPRDATGARVTLTSSVGTQVREITSGNGHFNTQSTRRIMFGLGQDTGAADVTIRWPDGTTQALGNLKANQRLRVTQDGDIEILD